VEVSLQGGVRMMSILELLQHIVNELAPMLTLEGRFLGVAEFVDVCLLKGSVAGKYQSSCWSMTFLDC